MSASEPYPYVTRLDIKYPALALVDVPAMDLYSYPTLRAGAVYAGAFVAHGAWPMSKDQSFVTAYLDYCASSEIRTRLFNGPPLSMEEVMRDTDTQNALWRACLDAGWTEDELDAAFLERFKDDPRVPRIIEERRQERDRERTARSMRRHKG